MKRRIGIIAAQREEALPLITRLKDCCHGLYLPGDIEVVMTNQSNVGKLNAMHSAYQFISDYEVTEILNIGVASGRGSLQVGDTVSVSRVYDGDFDISVFDHPKFYVPGVGDYISIDDSLPFKSVPCFTVSRFEQGSLHTDIEDYVIDMEFYSIAYLCSRYNIPCHSIKVISDTLVKHNHVDYMNNLTKCCEHLASQVWNYLQVP